MSAVCRREPEVRRAAATNDWSSDLRSHADSCADCAAAASVAPWMAQFAALPDREHRLPDPSVVFLKARLLQNTIVAERAMGPMTSLQMAAYLIVAAGWAALLTWKWNVIDAWLHRLSPGRMILGASADSASFSMTFLAAILILSSVTIMVALHTILVDE